MVYHEDMRVWDFRSIPNKSGVYIIWNSLNQRFYIGSSHNMRNRFKQHLSGLFRGQHSNKAFQECFNAHGLKAFEFAVLENVTDGRSLEPLERAWMLKYGAPENPLSYNIVLAGDYFGRASNA